MAAAKTGTNVVSSQTSSAGSAQDAVNSGDISLTTSYGATISGKVTNGGTGPTLGCVVNIYVSRDPTNYILFQTFTAGVANSGVYPFTVKVDESVLHAKLGFGGNTGQAVTVYGDSQTLDTI